LIDDWQMVRRRNLRFAAPVLANFNFANGQTKMYCDNNMPGLVKGGTP
jgi:hypothetical protein